MSAAGDGASEPADGSHAAPTDRSLPRTTARAVVVATVLGSLGVLFRAPLAGAGTAAGALVGAGLWRSTDGPRAMTVGAALVPLVAFGLVAGIGWLAESPLGIVPAALGVVAGLAVVGTVRDTPRHDLQRVGWVGLVAGIAVGGVALVALAVGPAGGLGAAIWVFGRTAVGFVLSATVATVAVAGAVYVLPLAAVVTPRQRERAERARTWVVRAAPGAVALLLFGTAVLGMAGALDPVGTSGPVRLLLFAVTVLAGTLGGVWFLVSQSWQSAGERTKPIFGWIMSSSRATGHMHNPVLGVTVAICAGVALLFVGVVGWAGVTPTSQLLLGLTALVLGVGGIAAMAYARGAAIVSLPDATTILAGALGLQAVVVTFAGRGDAVGGPTVDGLATLVALTAALFVYATGQYGRTLASEVGDSATRRPQLVWLGRSAVVGVVGLVAAAALYWVATTFPPVLSGPSRVGVTAGVVALGAVTWLLLRR